MIALTTVSSMRFSRRDLVAIAALFLVICVPFARFLIVWPTPLIFPNDAFHYGTDLIRESWSNFRYTADILHTTGSLALWRPFLLSGAPLIGHPVAPILYPLNGLTLILPLPLAFNLIFLMHLCWAGLGCYLFLRRVSGLRTESAWVGALIFALAPRLITHVGGGHLPLIEALAWWPWAWLAFSLYWRDLKLYWAVLLGIAVGAMAMTDGRYLAMSGVWVGVCTLWIGLRGRIPALRRAIVLALTVGIVGIGLSAGELLPLANLLPYSNRAGVEVEPTGGLEPAFLLNTLFRSTIVEPESYTFMGIMAIVLALYGFAAVTRYREGAWLLGAFLTAILSLGTNLPLSLYPLLMRVIPIFALFRAPGRWWPYTIFAVAVLAAYGFEKWLGGTRTRAWLRPMLLGLCLVYAAIAIVGQNLPFLYFPQVIILPVGAMLLMSRPKVWQRGLVLALVALDLLIPNLELLVPQSEAALTAPDAVVAYATQTLKPGERIFAPYGLLPEAAPVANHLATADGYDSFAIGVYTEVMRAASGCAYSGYVVGVPPTRADYTATLACPTLKPTMPILHLLNIRLVLLPSPTDLPGGTLVYHDEKRWLYDLGAAPPTLVRQVEIVSPAQCVDRLATLDTSSNALIESGDSGPAGQFVIQNRQALPNGERFTIDADAPAFLVRSETWVPGWTAYLDDQPDIKIAVQRTDCAFQGVTVPAGTHTVTFIYDPPAFELGWRLSVFTVGLVIVYALWVWGKRTPSHL
jgi:hypothetical protein